MTFFSMGIDVGTTGVRTAVVDQEGTLISNAEVRFSKGHKNKRDTANWWAITQGCIFKQISNLSELSYPVKRIKFVTVCSTSGTVLLADKNLRPITKPLMYDSAGFNAEGKIIKHQSPQQEHISIGNNSVLARTLKLQSEDKENNAKYLMHQADFITACLCGLGGYTDKNNALKLGYDLENECWPDWYSRTGLRVDLLPKVLPVGYKLGYIRKKLSETFGFSNKVTICSGTTDSVASFLACATPKEGTAVTSLGTTLAIKLASSIKIEDPSIGLYSHRLNGLWLVGGASNSGGGVLKKYFTDKKIINLSKDINTNTSSKLDYYPLRKMGERFPINDPYLKPKVTPRPKSDLLFLHGLLEGIARIEASGYKQIRNRGGPPISQLFTCGGGAINEVWSKIRSKHLGIKINTPRSTEASFGTALIPILKLKP